MRTLTVLALALLLASCTAAPRAGDAAQPPEVAVKIGQSADCGGGLVIRFEAVLQDSRCPQGAACVWAGNARIALAATAAGKEPARLELNTGLEPKSATVAGRTVELLRLEPLRKVHEDMDPKAYVATLKISGP